MQLDAQENVAVCQVSCSRDLILLGGCCSMTVLDTLKRHLPPVNFFPVFSDFELDDEAGTIFFQAQVLSFRMVLCNFLISLLKAFGRIFQRGFIT